MYGPDDKELKAFLQAMNCQMKTDERSYGNSNCLSVPIAVSAKDHVDDSFHDPGEDSEFMQESVHGEAELTLSSGDGHDFVDVLAAFAQPTFHIHQRPTAGEGLSFLDRHKPFVPSVRRGDVVLY